MYNSSFRDFIPRYLFIYLTLKLSKPGIFYSMQFQGGSATDPIIFNSLFLFSLLKVTMDYGQVNYVHHNFINYGGPSNVFGLSLNDL